MGVDIQLLVRVKCEDDEWYFVYWKDYKSYSDDNIIFDDFLLTKKLESLDKVDICGFPFIGYRDRYVFYRMMGDDCQRENIFKPDNIFKPKEVQFRFRDKKCYQITEEHIDDEDVWIYLESNLEIVKENSNPLLYKKLCTEIKDEYEEYLILDEMDDKYPKGVERFAIRDPYFDEALFYVQRYDGKLHTLFKRVFNYFDEYFDDVYVYYYFTY